MAHDAMTAYYYRSRYFPFYLGIKQGRIPCLGLLDGAVTKCHTTTVIFDDCMYACCHDGQSFTGTVFVLVLTFDFCYVQMYGVLFHLGLHIKYKLK